MLSLMVGGTVLSYLALFAWRFADERLYADSGYYLVRLINEGSFRIEHGRWVLAFSQLLPLLGVKLGAGMSDLILLHSLNNVVWMTACMLMAWRVLHDRAAVLAIALLHLIGLSDGLFCPVFELYYAADLLVLFTALLRSTSVAPRPRMIGLLALLPVITSSHLFGAALLAASLVIHEVWKERRLAIALASVFALQLTWHAFHLSAYEKDHLSFVKRIDAAAILDLFSPQHVLASIGYGIAHYPDVTALVGLGLFILYRAGLRRQTAFVLFFVLASWFVIALKLPGFLHDRYREQVNFPIAAWAVLMTSFLVLPLNRMRSVIGIVIILGIGYRMVEAERLSPGYRARTAWIKREIALAHDLGRTKGIVPAPMYFGPPAHAIEGGWSVSVESLLLSAKAGPDSTVSLISDADLACPGVTENLDRFVLRCWDILPVEWLDGRWFTPPQGRYAPLSSEEVNR